MNEHTQIKDLTQDTGHPNMAWSWTVHDYQGCISYWTNGEGEGIFSRRHDGTWNQHTGLMQFSLAGCTRSAAYHRIRRYFGGSA